MKKYKLVIIFLVIAIMGKSQPTFYRTDLIGFYQNGDSLTLAQVGGLNNPQFNAADLNHDGYDDLVVFDRAADRVLPFLSDGSSYSYAPRFAANFPTGINGFVLLRDYNCDGVQDLFSYPALPVPGIEAYRGYYNAAQELVFQKIIFPNQAFDILSYPGFNNFMVNIYVARDDYPALDDLDGDGDLDVLAFNDLGGRISYYENQSQDLGYGCDTFIYKLVDNCWGRFYESGITAAISLSPSVDSCFGTNSWIGGRHAGSTLMTFDADNDGDKEIVLGDLSFNNFIMLTNGGTLDTAFMTAQDTFFPSYNLSANINIFPAAFYLDVDFDGIKDFVGAPNAANAIGTIAENYYVAWWYKNQQSNAFPAFDFQQKDFLVDQMVDVGSNAAPTYFDYNADGRLDLVIGNFGYADASGNFVGSLALYENIGTATFPNFQLVTRDYLNVATLGLRWLRPTFGDLDNDGDDDLLIGEESGKLYYYRNMAGAGAVANFAPVVQQYQSIDVGQTAAPQIIDVDKDGLKDLLIGDRNGLLSFYKNTGTATAPVFVLQPNNNFNNAFGNVDVRAIGYNTGYAVPYLFDDNGTYRLYVGSESGAIQVFDQIENHLADAFNVVSTQYAGIREGKLSAVVVRDISGDGKPELTIGNIRGGITILSPTDLAVHTVPVALADNEVAIFPNPAADYFHLQLSHTASAAATIRLFNTAGAQITAPVSGSGSLRTVDVSRLPSGVYLIQIIDNQQIITKKIVKQ